MANSRDTVSDDESGFDLYQPPAPSQRYKGFLLDRPAFWKVTGTGSLFRILTGTEMAESFKGELPYLMRLLAAPSGLLPLGFFLTRSLRDLARRKPQLFERLGEHRQTLFFIDPTDLNYAFVIVPDGTASEVKMVDKKASKGSDVIVRGPLLSLLGLLDGTFDGDALFFSRSISISGKVDALLALRNAIEDADLKPSDFIGLGGGIGSVANSVVLNTIAVMRRLAGAPAGTSHEH